jgi:hypothetical protein
MGAADILPGYALPGVLQMPLFLPWAQQRMSLKLGKGSSELAVPNRNEDPVLLQPTVIILAVYDHGPILQRQRPS